jgi:hypothetical protein
VQDPGLTEFISFTGHLKASDCITPVTFSTRIGHSGEVEFQFGSIALTQETSFIMKYWNHECSTLNCFSLSGISSNEVEFATKTLQFNSLRRESSKEGTCMSPIGCCSQAEFRRKLLEPVPKPIIRMHVKSFQNFSQLNSKCSLGTVYMDGNSSIVDPDTITGHISVCSDNEPANLSAWRTEADKLLEHVRQVMSFASSAVLQVPIIEYFAGDNLELVALSRTRQAPALMRTFHYLDQQPVFDAAVSSFFSPPHKIKNLFFAIEWFAEDATYNEVRLVNAMTALENLVASNLDDNDSMIRPPKEFKKIKKVLSQVITECVNEWSGEDAEKAAEIVVELNDKLLDLNRRSILRKVKILAKLWSVPLDDIGDKQIQNAKTARDQIVHRGHYYEDGKVKTDLWEHVTIMREIVIRFLLSIIGYKGRYISYHGGHHDAQFPPQVDISNAH